MTHCATTGSTLLNDPLRIRSASRQHYWHLRHVAYSTDPNKPSEINDTTSHIQTIARYYCLSLSPDLLYRNANYQLAPIRYLVEAPFESPGWAMLTSIANSAVNFGSQLNFEITLLDELSVPQTATLLSQTLLNFVHLSVVELEDPLMPPRRLQQPIPALPRLD